SKDDKITFILSTNDGQDILTNQTGTSITNRLNQSNQIEYVVRSDGKVLLPVVGEIHIEGMTVKRSEDTLKTLFSHYYLNPFVQVTVTNKRVIVFPGDGGEAKVVIIKNNNTTLMEVIA